MSVTASPADYNSWEAVRNELMSEAKKGLKARVEAEVAAAKEDDDLDAMKVAFQGEERDLEHSIDHEVHTFSCVLDVEYNVRRCTRLEPALPTLASRSLSPLSLACAVPLQVDAHFLPARLDEPWPVRRVRTRVRELLFLKRMLRIPSHSHARV